MVVLIVLLLQLQNNYIIIIEVIIDKNIGIIAQMYILVNLDG